MFLGTPTVEMGGVFYSFACPWNPSPPTKFFSPFLICGFVPSLIVTSYDVFNTPSRLAVFLREMGAVDLGESEGGGGNWELWRERKL